MSIKDDIEYYFKDVVFLVEANTYEEHSLWLTFHYKDVGFGQIKSWEQEGMGHGVIIGYLDKRPINLSLTYAKIDGRRVCFYHGTSQLVDHQMIRDWLHERTGHLTWAGGFRPAYCDAMNFHLCLDAIRELNEKN